MKPDPHLPIPTESLRHPMWSRLAPDADLEPWRVACLNEIEVRLRPFDGRPGSIGVISFCQEVWLLAHNNRIENPVMLAGEIALTSARRADRPQGQVIGRLANQFVDAIAKEIA